MKLTGEQNPFKFQFLSDFFQKLSARMAGWPLWQASRTWILRQPRWKIALLTAGSGLFVVGFFLTVMILLVRVGTFGPLPTYGELGNIQNDQASEIYDQQGVLLGKYYVENRVNADSSELPEYLIQALIATEDARFFNHQGIDLRSLARVLVKSILLSDESSGGGSTISQQLAKNLYPREDYRFCGILINKLREMLIARRLEKIYPKDYILRLYLNTVPFDGNAYGVKIASKRFFNRNLDQLRLEEAAVLVGMLKATSYYNPVRFPERALDRRNIVLHQMVRFGYLDTLRATDLLAKPLKLDYQPESHNLGLATYFREHLRLEVEQRLKEISKPDGTSYNLYTDGLRIFTTLDATLQRYAEESVRDHLPTLQKAFDSEWRGKEPWFTRDVKNMLIKRSPRYRNLATRGLTEKEILPAFEKPVTMTIFDWEKGEKEVVMSPLDSIRYYLRLLHTGMLVAEPESGSIRAWVGGIDHRFMQYDHVKSKRQIGSVIKPLVYAAALRSGIKPCEYFENSLVQYAEYNGWEPHNSDEVYGGYYSMEGALTHSINTVAVDVALETGLASIIRVAGEMGMQGDIPQQPSIALGAVDASLLEMIEVYGTLANQGLRTALHFLDRIETADGKILIQGPGAGSKKTTQVLSREEAAVMTHLMQSVIDSGTARRLRYDFGLTGAIAGKTGTTQNQSDGWFIGFAPRLVAGVWIGAELPLVHFKSIRTGQGSSTALPVWGRFMRKVQANPKTVQYTRGTFPSPTDTMLAQLDCPHYLPDLPGFFDSIINYDQLLELVQVAGTIDTGQLMEIIRDAPRRNTESVSEYSRRIRERNQKILEKRERKQRRKEFFDKLLGRREN
jgi:penicillin-binding protein 1A